MTFVTFVAFVVFVVEAEGLPRYLTRTIARIVGCREQRYE
jgi:hypothetical protein